MAVTLYHFTAKESVSAILRNGFANGEGDLVWFTEDPGNAWGATATNCLLQVVLDINPADLSQYSREVVPEDNDQDIPSPRWQFFAIPAEIANPLSSVKVVSDEERRDLMT